MYKHFLPRLVVYKHFLQEFLWITDVIVDSWINYRNNQNVININNKLYYILLWVYIALGWIFINLYKNNFLEEILRRCSANTLFRTVNRDFAWNVAKAKRMGAYRASIGLIASRWRRLLSLKICIPTTTKFSTNLYYACTIDRGISKYVWYRDFKYMQFFILGTKLLKKWFFITHHLHQFIFFHPHPSIVVSIRHRIPFVNALN